MKNRTCSYVYEFGEECARKHLARGYCEAHYKRSKSGLNMDAPIRKKAKKNERTALGSCGDGC